MTAPLALPSVDQYDEWKDFARALLNALQSTKHETAAIEQNLYHHVTHIDPGSLPTWPDGYRPLWMSEADAALYMANSDYDPPTAPDLVYIDTIALADAAITVQKVRDSAISEAKLFDEAVTTLKIAAVAVETAKIATAAVNTTKLADLAVSSGKLIDEAVVTAKLANTAVTTAKIAFLAVTAAEIANATITQAKLGLLSVGTAQIIDLSASTAKIADAAVTSLKVLDGAIVTAKIGDAAIVSAKIGNLAVLTAHLQNANVTTLKVADAAIVSAKIANAAILTALIGDAQIVTAKIADLAVNTAKMADLSVTSAKIANLAVGNAHIINVSAEKLLADSALVNRIYVGGADFALHGGYGGAGKGALRLLYGDVPLIHIGWFDAATFGFELRNTSDKVLISHTDTLSLSEITAEISAMADDGIISHSEKGSFARQDARLRSAYAALRTRASDLALSLTAKNLIGWSEIVSDDVNKWSGTSGATTPVPQGTTTAGPDGAQTAWWLLDNKFMGSASQEALVVGAVYTQSFWIKANMPGQFQIAVRKPGASSTIDLTNQSVVTISDKWQRIQLPVAALGSSQTSLVFEGRNTFMAGLGLPNLPTGFAIAVWRAQLNPGTVADPPVLNAAAAVASQEYLETAKVDYDKALANITPPLPNLADAELFPIDNVLTGSTGLGTGWSNSGTGSGPTALPNGFVRITDSATGAFFFRHQNVTAPAGEMPIAVKVLKDAVGKATRYASISVDAVNEMRFDTSTGESFRSGGTQGGVIDGGEHWLVWIQGTVAAASISVRVYPARGAGALTSISAAATGSIDVKDAQAFFGALTAERRKLNFQNKVDLFGIALERAQKAISEEDSRRSDKLNAAPSQNILYDWTGTTSSALPKMLTCTITSGPLDVTAGYTFAFVGNGCTVDQTGAANGQTRLTAVAAANAFIAVTATRTGGAAPLIGTIPVTRTLADNPDDSGGGAGETSFGPREVSASISDTSYDASPQPLMPGTAPQMRTNGSGQMRLVLSSSYQALTGNVTITAKAQRATASGGPWTDISGTSVGGSNSSAGFWNDLNGNGIMEVGEWEDGFEGAANFNALVTVGTANTDYFIRWIAFKTGTPSGVTVSGSASGAQT